jgi:hypothetical protein
MRDAYGDECQLLPERQVQGYLRSLALTKIAG